MTFSEELLVESDVSADGKSVRLRLNGEVDASSAHLVEDALTPALDPRCERLVVDLAGVTFMDSSGLRVLVVARNALAGRGAGMVIAGANDQLRRLFEITGLTGVFTFEP
jgi:stage II sporulation protein AA (anti-sigma F factor antagonist)